MSAKVCCKKKVCLSLSHSMCLQLCKKRNAKPGEGKKGGKNNLCEKKKTSLLPKSPLCHCSPTKMKRQENGGKVLKAEFLLALCLQNCAKVFCQRFFFFLFTNLGSRVACCFFFGGGGGAKGEKDFFGVQILGGGVKYRSTKILDYTISLVQKNNFPPAAGSKKITSGGKSAGKFFYLGNP